MKKETIIVAIVVLVVGIMIGSTLTPVIERGSRMMGGQMGNNIDSHFIEQMIPHHEDAIIMANLALTRAEHSQIKTLANDIIKAQSAEIGQMKSWYKMWFGNDVPVLGSSTGHGAGMMSGGMMGNESDVKSLKDAKPFDKEFIAQMIPHHQMAVMMAQMLLNSTDRAELRQLAKNIISSQTEEINKMREWHRIWYGN